MKPLPPASDTGLNEYINGAPPSPAQTGQPARAASPGPPDGPSRPVAEDKAVKSGEPGEPARSARPAGPSGLDSQPGLPAQTGTPGSSGPSGPSSPAESATAPPAGRLWPPVILASLILMVAMGTRQTIGLFVEPVLNASAMNIAEMSMALAVGQLMWGAFQPLFGIWADRRGPFPVLLTGALLLFAGQLCTVWAASFLPMTLAQGLLSPAGQAAMSFSVLIAVVGRRLPAGSMSVAGGVINAGGSLGQFAYSPVVQWLISARGYAGGLLFLGLTGLSSIAPAWFLGRGRAGRAPVKAAVESEAGKSGLKRQLRAAFGDRSYILLQAGFFTCGFHVAFLTTHLPQEVSLCGHSASVSAISISLIGLCNIAGSILAGILGKYFRMKLILSSLYAFRALMIAVYLLSPKTEATFYIFAVTTGFTWLATVPPTAGIVGKLFGTRYLATLFGLTFLTHQVGGFLGAWLGGLAIQTSGNLLWVWYLDIALAAIAAVVNLPIREEKPARRKAA